MITETGHSVAEVACSLDITANVLYSWKKKFCVTTNSKHKLPVWSNVLNRNFRVPNKVYVPDITYV